MPPTPKQITNELQRILRAYDTRHPQLVQEGKLTRNDANHRSECLVEAIRLINQPVPQPSAQREWPVNPLAKSVSELATPKQVVMIRGICRDLDLDDEQELKERYPQLAPIKTEELSRRAASAFIGYLKDLQGERELDHAIY